MDKSDSQLTQPSASESALMIPEGEVLPAPDDTPTPVKSAKDAINARFANRPSNSTPKSAQEVINGTAVDDDSVASRSATSLHHSGGPHRRMESVRPSASALLQPAKPRKTAPSVVRTSLKLAPKRTPAPRPQRLTNITSSANSTLRPRKQATRLSMDIAGRRPASSHAQSSAVSAIKAAAVAATPHQSSPVSVKVGSPAKTTPKKSPTKALPAPRKTSNGHVFQDVVRPARPAAQSSADSTPAASLSIKSHKTAAKSKLRPLDSIKNRFRPAPKGYSATDSAKIRPARLPRAEDFLNPSQALSKADDDDDATHLYGLTEPPANLSYSDVPSWVASEVKDEPSPAKPAVAGDDLGVVEDYRPQPGDPIAVPVEEPVPVAKKASPDNNRYALGAQSPYFLKSVQVEKRPLSDSSPLPPRREPSVYAAQSLDAEAVSQKNTYAKKKTSKKPKKSSNATVIVPARRRSHAPLFALLLLTVILGAVVGAAAYLFFFQ